MTWKIFNADFKAVTPLHIGYRKIGFLQSTRYYVPGKNLWGALTAKITPLLNIRDHTGALNYKEVGDFLSKNLIFSYFFLKSNGKEFKPKYCIIEGLKYGQLSVAELEKKFISSIPSTAIESESMSADYGSLHEIEIILSRQKKDKEEENDKQGDVFITGNIFIKEGKEGNLNLLVDGNIIKLNNVNVNDILKEGIQIGGERRYGFGLIKAHNLGQSEGKDYDVVLTELVRKIKANTSIEAHLKISDYLVLRGDIEAVVGREWDNKGAGRGLSKGFLAWTPGSVVESDINVKILEFGILEFDH
jgi:hypothetical protein